MYALTLGVVKNLGQVSAWVMSSDPKGFRNPLWIYEIDVKELDVGVNPILIYHPHCRAI